MVRDLQEMRIRVLEGDTQREVPLSTVATIKEGRGYSEIRRVDGRRVKTSPPMWTLPRWNQTRLLPVLRLKNCPSWG